MSAIARRVLASDRAVAGSAKSRGTAPVAGSKLGATARPDGVRIPSARACVFVAAENPLVREALAHMLARKGNIEVTWMEPRVPLLAESVAETNADVLLLVSSGAVNDDLLMVQQVHAAAPGMRILLLGMAENEAEIGVEEKCVKGCHS